MNKTMMYWVVMFGLTAGIGVSPAAGQARWGRDLEGRRTWLLGLGAGSVFNLDGEVQETTRPIEVIGGPTSGSPPENYSWKELGFDQEFPTFGLTFEKMWTYVTIQSQFLMGSPSVNSVADRDYYIGVGSVVFNGVEYEYMVIPEGSEFSGEIDLYALDVRTLFTPFSFGSTDYMTFTPWVHLGFYSFIADYEVDAGVAIRVTQYENPPRDYVVGGRGSGTSPFVVPEIGIGAEWGVALNDRSTFYLQGYAAFLTYRGSTKHFGVRARNEKSVAADYRTFGARALLEMGIGDRMDLVAGVELKHMVGDAEVRAVDRPDDDILTMREKFDKDVHFELTSFMAFVGLRF